MYSDPYLTHFQIALQRKDLSMYTNNLHLGLHFLLIRVDFILTLFLSCVRPARERAFVMAPWRKGKTSTHVVIFQSNVR